MRLRRLGVLAFGRFRGLELGLEPGLNVVQGPNEAGKSTLFQFIAAMLYGFNKPGLRVRRADDRRDAFRPWIGDAYEGWLEYEHEGRTYRVERRFDRDEVRVRDAATGRDLTPSFSPDPAVHEPDFARRHTGLAPVVFRDTVSVPQLRLATGDDLAREVQGQLRELGAGGGEDVSVQRALDALDRRLEEIGTERAPTRPLGQKLREVEALSAELRQIQERLSAIRADELGLAEAVRAREALAARLAGADAALERLEGSHLGHRLAAARLARQAVDEARAAAGALARYAAFPAGRRDALLAAEQRRTDQAAARARAAAEVARLEAAVAEARRRVDAHPELKAFDAASLGAVRADFDRFVAAGREAEEADRRRAEAEAALAEAERALDAALPAGWRPWLEAGVRPAAEVERLAREVARLEASPRRADRAALEAQRDAARLQAQQAGLVVLLGLLVAAASAVATAVHSPSWALGILLSLALALVGWRRRAAAAATGRAAEAALRSEAGAEEAALQTYRAELERLRRAAGVAGLDGLRELARSAEALAGAADAARRGLEPRRAEADAAGRRYAEARNRIRGHLAAAGALEDGREPDAGAVQAFEERLRAHLEDRERLRDLERDLRANAERRDEAARAEAAAAAEVEAVCAEAGVAGVAEFLEAWEKHQARVRAAGALEKAERELEAHLAGATLEELEARAAALGVTAGEAGAGVGADAEAEAEAVPAGVETAIQNARAAREELRRELAETEDRIARLESRIETAVAGLRPASEVAEALAAARRELARLRLYHAALTLARDTIAQVAADLHREFAPRLNAAVAATLAGLTGGRYRQVRVGEDLAVSLEAPETGQLVPLERLSGGTIDQAYFALRLAIAEIVSGRRDLPLFLDDSFIQYDDGRLDAALGLLAGLAAERQVVLFTCHRREMAALGRLGIPHHAVELSGP